MLGARKAEFCKMWFWEYEKLTPTSIPMKSPQIVAARANWTFDPRAGERGRMVWSCSVEPDPAQCFR